MTSDFKAIIQWVHADCGGRSHPPFVGMRPGIRWQAHVDAWLAGGRDVEVIDLSEPDEKGLRWATLGLRSSVPTSWLQPGELIEILDGPRVIGVGTIR